MNILYVTTIGGTMNFFKSFIAKLIEDGHNVEIACNEKASAVNEYFKELGCVVHQISCLRSPLKKGNLTAIKELKKIVSEKHYDIVHCHTPIAAACTRIACRKARKNGTKVIYTAHGFHFYKGAPKKNWLIFYTIEKFCARYTDVLITINKEDYERAKKKFKAKSVEYVPGVGINVEKFSSVDIDKLEKRCEIGVPENCTLLLSVGELNKNKNQEIVIRALSEINDSSIHYVIAGAGGNEKYLRDLADGIGVGENVHLLGYRKDIPELCKAADIFVHPSFREGLPVAVMEAMASGLPVICSKIRGNVDLIDKNGGMVCSPEDVLAWHEAISCLYKNPENCVNMGKKNNKKAEGLDVKAINETMLEIYAKVSN